MDRRTYTREALLLTIKLVLPGLGAYSARILDFSLGGLFMVPDEPIGLDVNDPVQIQFSLDQDYRLRARVVAAFKGGFGCAFFDPDAEALAALKRAAKQKTSQRDPGAARPARSELSPSAVAIVDYCKDKYEAYLTTHTNAMFEHAEQSLFISARDAKSNGEQTLYYDTMRELNRFKTPINEHFSRALVKQLDRLGDQLDAMEEPEEIAGSQLSLVESGEFADWLAIKQIHSRAEPRYEVDGYKLNKRLSVVADTRVDDDNNPLGIAAICHTFHDALQGVDAPRLARKVLLEAFDTHVIDSLGTLYQEINGHLEAAGVLPGLEMPVPKVAKVPKSKAPPSAGPQAVEADPDFNESTGAPSAGGHYPSPSAASTGGMATGPRAMGFARAAGNEQHPFAAAPAIDQAFADLWEPQPLNREPPPGGAHAIDLAESTGELAPHPSILAGEMFDRSAAVTGHVYRTPKSVTHTAFGTARALMGIQDQVANAARPSTEVLPDYDPTQVRGALDLLQSQEASQPNARTSSVALKERVLRALRSRHGYADKKAIPREQGQMIDMIAELVTSIVEDELVAALVKPSLQRLEVPLLNTALRNPDYFASPEHPARRVINEISNIPESRNALVKARTRETVETVVDQIVRNTEPDDAVFEQACEQLQAFAMERERLRADNLKALVKSSDEQQALIRSRTGESPAPTAERELPEEWRQSLDRAKRLRVGDAMLLDKGTERQQRAALAWIGDEHSSFVFADGDGAKASSLSLQELAMQLRRGTADVIPETELPAMDRGMYSMLRRMHDKMIEQTAQDQLTELLNRRELELRITALIERARKDHSTHALCHLDIDRFHEINEKCGRSAGDRLLKELGKTLQKRLGGENVIARLGGDKFGILVVSVDDEQAFEIADKQRTRIESFKIAWKGERLSISASVGIAQITEMTDSATSVLERGERACRKGKSLGGNRVEVDRDKTTTTQSEDDQKKRIQDSINLGHLQLRCQKIAPLDENAQNKPYYEVLLGVADDKDNPSTPGEFVQAAEHCGEIIKVDRWIIENAFKWMAENKRRLLKLGGLTINLSSQSLSNQETLEFVLEQFNISRLPPRKVLFEVSENEAISSLSNAENFIRVLGEYGCRFILDDFGNGNTSYSYLKHLPIDYVKIDGMFVRDMVNNPNDQAMVKSINEIGHFMDKQTVAEFVENQEIIDLLKEFGIDYVQGFGVEKPLLLNELR